MSLSRNKFARSVVMLEITPNDQAMLKFLRQTVDRLAAEEFRLDAHPNVKQDLFKAREELREFTSSLRQKGVNI